MPGTEELFIVIISHGTGHGAPCGCLQLVGHILKGVAFGECGASSATFKTFEFIQNSYVYIFILCIHICIYIYTQECGTSSAT